MIPAISVVSTQKNSQDVYVMSKYIPTQAHNKTDVYPIILRVILFFVFIFYQDFNI